MDVTQNGSPESTGKGREAGRFWWELPGEREKLEEASSPCLRVLAGPGGGRTCRPGVVLVEEEPSFWPVKIEVAV